MLSNVLEVAGFVGAVVCLFMWAGLWAALFLVCVAMFAAGVLLGGDV